MSQITLNIYRRNPETKRREFDRVVTAETAFIPFGPVQDILEVIDVDAVIGMMNGQEVDDKTAFVAAIAPAIVGAMKEIVPILLDTFADVTEEELRMCDIADICRVVIELLALAIGTMFAKKAKKNMTNAPRMTAQ